MSENAEVLTHTTQFSRMTQKKSNLYWPYSLKRYGENRYERSALLTLTIIQHPFPFVKGFFKNIFYYDIAVYIIVYFPRNVNADYPENFSADE